MTFQIKTRLRSLSAAERLCLIMGILFAASLIPLLILSFYAHPAGDDYVYGVQAHLTWEGTHSLIETIKTALSTVKNYYGSWQGTYSSIFLMALQPAVFSQRLYFLTTFLMLGMLTAGTAFLIHILFTRYLRFPLSLRLILTFSVLTLCIQNLEEGKSAFYWYNGAVHYVFMHSCMLFLLAFLLLFLKAGSRAGRSSALRPPAF